MTDEAGSDRILTIPNAVSFVRLAAVPVFWWLLLAEDEVALAAILVFTVGWTDWIDGYLARKLNQVTKLGKLLDPIADRLMIASAVVGGLIAGVIPGVIGVPLIAREAFMGLITLWMVSKGAGTLTVRYLGKVATFGLYGAIPFFYLASADILADLMRPIAWVMGIIALVLYWAVALTYLGDARRAIANVESRPEDEES